MEYRWQKHVGKQSLSHTEICRCVTAEYSWKCLALLCKDSRGQLMNKTRLPSDVIDMIVCEFLGPFAAPSKGYRNVNESIIVFFSL